MADRYQQLIDSPPGRFVSKQFGLPRPEHLRRYEPGQPLMEGPALLGGDGALLGPVRETLEAAREEAHDKFSEDLTYGALVFDASGIRRTEELRRLYDFFHPAIRSVRPSGRVLVLGRPPDSLDDPRAHTAQWALEGFTRSVGKELRRGATIQLVYVEDGAEAGMESTLRFLLSSKSAYVDGQVVRIGPRIGGLSDPQGRVPSDADQHQA